MNRILRNTVLGTLASLLISGFCLAEERTVRIYNWIEYLPPEVLKSFQEETGIRRPCENSVHRNLEVIPRLFRHSRS